jgi:hypothetical protein
VVFTKEENITAQKSQVAGHHKKCEQTQPNCFVAQRRDPKHDEGYG